MKRILIFLLFSLSFAAQEWQVNSALAMITAVSILAVLFAISIGFEMQELNMFAKHELYEVITSAFLLVLFLSLFSSFDEIGKGITGKTFPNASSDILKNDLNITKDMYNGVKNAALNLGLASSRNAFCSFIGISLGMTNCGAFRVLLNAITVGSGALMAAIVQLTALYLIQIFGMGFGLNILFPFGIFMRSFSPTRGAGSMLLAFVVGIYFVLPIAVYTFDQVVNIYETNAQSEITDKTTFLNYASELSSDNFVCNPWQKDREAESKVLGKIDELKGSLIIDSIVYFVFIKVTLVVIGSFSFMVFGMRFLAQVLGTQLDITSFSRLM